MLQALSASPCVGSSAQRQEPLDASLERRSRPPQHAIVNAMSPSLFSFSCATVVYMALVVPSWTRLQPLRGFFLCTEGNRFTRSKATLLWACLVGLQTLSQDTVLVLVSVGFSRHTLGSPRSLIIQLLGTAILTRRKRRWPWKWRSPRVQ